MVNKHSENYVPYSARLKSKEKRTQNQTIENAALFDSGLKLKDVPWSRNPAPFSNSTQINMTTSTRAWDSSHKDK